MNWIKQHAHSLELLAFSLFLLIQPRLVGEDVFTAHDWDKVGLGALMLLVAYVGANTNATVGRYAKQVGVVGTAVLVSADNLLDGPWSSQKTMQVIVAGVVAAGALLGSTAPKAVLPSSRLDDVGDVPPAHLA